ncbi:MAG TPA: alpha/beta hydrolase [Oceanithermus profundus]|uniref:Alpha/beta hydrolase n=1 Tax=Oceanithermus profundus TaxID=187137 RepID=A0A7C4Z6C7_9DEIN|nr:alpha/beta hydrolase [Oceanithermus profundus]
MTRIEVEGHEGRRFFVVVEGDPRTAPLALVFPGLRYSPARPLLHYSRMLLRHHGWAVAEAWYDYDRPEFLNLAQAERHTWITADALAVWNWARASAAPKLLIGKSIGTLAMAFLMEHAGRSTAAKVWLTPLLRADDVLHAIQEDASPGLLVAGGADPATPPELLRKLERPGLHLLVLPGAGHGLEVSEPVRTLDLMRDYLEALDAFLDVL